GEPRQKAAVEGLIEEIGGAHHGIQALARIPNPAAPRRGFVAPLAGLTPILSAEETPPVARPGGVRAPSRGDMLASRRCSVCQKGPIRAGQEVWRTGDTPVMGLGGFYPMGPTISQTSASGGLRGQDPEGRQA